MPPGIFFIIFALVINRKHSIFFFVALLSAFSLLSCGEPEPEPEPGPIAELQILYVEPDAVYSRFDIDSVFVNDVLVATVDGPYPLKQYNGIPYKKYIQANAGPATILFYRRNDVVYEKTTILHEGRQHLFVYDLSKEPIVIQDDFPYEDGIFHDPETFATYRADSVITAKFVNLAYDDKMIPCQGKLYCEWHDPKNFAEGHVWHRMGRPIGFGESTELYGIALDQAFSNLHYYKIDFRFLKEDGMEYTYFNLSNQEKPFTEYDNVYAGQSYIYVLCGNRKRIPGSVYPENNGALRIVKWRIR